MDPANETTPASTPLTPAESAEIPASKPSPEKVARDVLESRSVRLFRPSNERFDPRRISLPDDFFEPSSEELAAAAKSLASGSHQLADAPLMTQKMRAAHAERRMSRFRKVFIRVLLPDRIALQGTFEPKSTVRQLQRFVRAALRDARNVQFHLFVVPPKMKLMDLDATLWSLGLVPAAMVHIEIERGGQDSGTLLKDWLLKNIEDTPLSVMPPPPKPVAAEESGTSNGKAPAEKSRGKKFPKWFKK